MTENIESQRAALENELSQLEAMSGLPTELILQAQEELSRRQAAIAEVQRKINAIESETGARVRHERVEAERQRLDRMKALRHQLVELSEQRLQAVGDAQNHAKALAGALRKAIEANAAMAKAAYMLSGAPAPVNFGEADFVRRLSARLSGVMSAGLGKIYQFRFGHLQWAGASTHPLDQSWAAAEERAITPALVSLIQKE